MSATSLCVRFVTQITLSSFTHRHLGMQRRHIITTPVVLASLFRWTTRRVALFEGKQAKKIFIIFLKNLCFPKSIYFFIARMLRNISWRSHDWSIKSTMSGEFFSETQIVIMMLVTSFTYRDCCRDSTVWISLQYVHSCSFHANFCSKQ